MSDWEGTATKLAEVLRNRASLKYRAAVIPAKADVPPVTRSARPTTTQSYNLSAGERTGATELTGKLLVSHPGFTPLAPLNCELEELVILVGLRLRTNLEQFPFAYETFFVNKQPSNKPHLSDFIEMEDNSFNPHVLFGGPTTDARIKCLIPNDPNVTYTQEEILGDFKQLCHADNLGELRDMPPERSLFLLHRFLFIEEALMGTLKHSSFFVADGDPDIVFDPDHDKKWQRAYESCVRAPAHYSLPRLPVEASIEKHFSEDGPGVGTMLASWPIDQVARPN